MTNRLFSVFLAAAAICTLPLAAQAQAPREACLQVGRIDSFSPIKGSNERAMVVTDKTFKKFKVSFITPCQGIDFNMGVGIKTLANTRLACVTRGDYVLSRDPGVAGDRCPIARVEAYTPAMEAADKAMAAAKSR